MSLATKVWTKMALPDYNSHQSIEGSTVPISMLANNGCQGRGKGIRMDRMQTMRRVGWILLLLLVVSCTKAYNDYSGPPRPESAIAVITPSSGVRIHAVNDKVVNVKPGTAKGLYVTYNRIHLQPGEHTLTLIPQGISTIKTYTRINVRVEAGKRYRVRSQFYSGATETGGYYKFWVDMEKTGEVVSAIVESRNPFQPRE